MTVEKLLRVMNRLNQAVMFLLESAQLALTMPYTISSE